MTLAYRMARNCQRCQHPNDDKAKFCLSCGAMLELDAPDPTDALIGKVLVGRYRPTRLLGEGGMGRVYLAEQKMGAATRKVAIKTLHPEMSSDPQLVARFHRESETVIQLSHPNTIQFYDFGELEDQTLFIVMEYIEGRSLASEMEKGRLDLARVDKIVIQMCGSLNEAHQRGIVHRDLKPDNVLLTERGGQYDFVKVLDFGIAKRNDAEDASQAKLTKQGMVLGTPPYMSPEQFSGKVLDPRSDIYSLGIMVYEMLVGELPFEGRTPWEWATKHLTTPPVPFELKPNAGAIPQNKRHAVMRALSKDPAQRQSTTLEFVAEFTGNADVQNAWMYATSTGGTSAPGMSPAPHTNAPQGHHGTAHMGAMGPQGFGTPQPAGFGSHPGGQQAGQQQGSQPGGWHSGPQQIPHSGAPQHNGGGQQMASQPGWGGAASQPWSTQSAPKSRGPLLAVVFGILVVGLGGGALAWAFSGGDSGGSASNGGVVTPPVNGNGSNVMVPIVAPVAAADAGTDSAPEASAPIVAATETTERTERTETTERRPPRNGNGNGNQQRPEASQENQIEARRIVSDGFRALRERNDISSALGLLNRAEGLVGRRSPDLIQLREQIAARGHTAVETALLQRQCGQAQSIYRRLRTSGLSRRQSFHPETCPEP